MSAQKLNHKWNLLVVAIIACTVEYFNPVHHINSLKQKLDEIQATEDLNKIDSVYDESKLQIVFVACGEAYVNESIVMVKSALSTSANEKSALKFIAYSDDPSQRLKLFAESEEVDMEIKRPDPPKNLDPSMKNIFRPCAGQRLFLPDLLPDIDRVLYVDTDIVFIQSPSNLWSLWKTMNSTQLAAVSEENKVTMANYYTFSSIPSPPNGLNTGVMLMDLAKMRAVQFIKRCSLIHAHFGSGLYYGDQCLLNVLFSFYPEWLKTADCGFNFRPDSCVQRDISCPNDPYLIHGNRRIFHKSEQDSERHWANIGLEEYKLGFNHQTPRMLLYAVFNGNHLFKHRSAFVQLYKKYAKSRSLAESKTREFQNKIKTISTRICD